jgi:hypothetical protein
MRSCSASATHVIAIAFSDSRDLSTIVVRTRDRSPARVVATANGAVAAAFGSLAHLARAIAMFDERARDRLSTAGDDVHTAVDDSRMASRLLEEKSVR